MSVSVKLPAELKKRKLSSRQKLQHNTTLGQLGEDRAVSFLLSKHYLIKDRNILTRSGELDIVAFDQLAQELVFCEVKTRTSNIFGHPSQAVGWRKRSAIYQAASEYLSRHPSNFEFRFDLITISTKKISHYKNITI